MLIAELYNASLVSEAPTLLQVASDAMSNGSIANQEAFVDQEIRALLDFSRSLTRLFIMLAVAFSAFYLCYGLFLMMASGGDTRNLDRSISVIRNVFIGLFLSIFSYLLISGLVTIYIRTVGLPDTVSFWSEDVFEDDFGIYRLLTDSGDYEYALPGEIILFQGTDVFVCEDPLSPAALNAGWEWKVDPAPGSDYELCVKQ